MAKGGGFVAGRYHEQQAVVRRGLRSRRPRVARFSSVWIVLLADSEAGDIFVDLVCGVVGRAHAG